MKPICVREYNKFMKDVDRADQYLAYYSILLKCKKWTKKTVLYLINCALFNAYHVYVKSSGNHIRFKKFLMHVACSWIGVNEAMPESGSHIQCNIRSPRHDPLDRLFADMRQHTIIRIIGRGRIENPRRACKVCSA